MLDRSAILRDAHVRAQWARAQVDHVSGKHHPYRHTLAYCLREAWRAAKERIQQALSAAALTALEEVEADDPTNLPARAAALRAFAATMPDHSDGQRQRRTLLAEADDLARAARCLPFTAPEPAYHAH